MPRPLPRPTGRSRLIPGAAARILLHAALLWGATLAAVEAQPSEAWVTRLEGFVDGVVTTGLDQDATAGAVMVVVSRDDVILSRGYRVGDARTGRAMNPEDDVIPLASISKVFTALAVLRLVEDGRLALDDPIAQHLPGLALDQPFGEIRVVHLLSHTAGLEDRHWGYLASHTDGGNASTLDQIAAVLPRQVRAPGEVTSYSNASYVLLGEIVAQVSGRAFEAYLADAVLAPLGVGDPRVMHAPPEQNGASPFHVWHAGRYVATPPAPFPAIHTPSGGLAMTGQEMARALQALLGGALEEGGEAGALAAALPRMQRPAWPDRAAVAGRTLGFWTEIWAGHRVYYHGGTHFGFHTNLVLVPSLDLAFFVAANGPTGAALTGVPRRALREMIAPEARPLAPRAPCDAACLNDVSGRFLTTRRNETGLGRLRAGRALAIDVRATEDSTLLITGLGYSRLFEAIGEDRFETPEGDATLGFRRDSGGRVVGAYLNGGVHAFDRAGFWHGTVSLTSGLWAALAGSLLCLAGAVAAWRSGRRVLGTPFWLAALWLGGTFVYLQVLRPILNGRDLSTQASAGPGLWSLTALYGAAVAALIWAVLWLLSPWDRARAPLIERIPVWAALPLFAWALLAAWMWNLPVAAPRW